MKIVGLTGGMGSGKTTVCNLFLEKGVPVYNSDLRAKWLMSNSVALKHEIQLLLGSDAYTVSGELNRAFVSNKIFQDNALLTQINNFVHPAVFNDFELWKNQQKTPFVLKESAILFESGGNLFCNYVIAVVGDLETRIKRVMERDKLSREEILSRMQHQWKDPQRIEKSNFVIYNQGHISELKEQVNKVYQEILAKT